MANRYPTFFTRDPLPGAFWCVAGTIGLINLGRSTSPWILWPIFFLWLYATVYRGFKTKHATQQERLFQRSPAE
jgi:hypothetical protein